jgi:hypothetical protein
MNVTLTKARSNRVETSRNAGPYHTSKPKTITTYKFSSKGTGRSFSGITLPGDTGTGARFQLIESSLTVAATQPVENPNTCYA